MVHQNLALFRVRNFVVGETGEFVSKFGERDENVGVQIQIAARDVFCQLVKRYKVRLFPQFDQTLNIVGIIAVFNCAKTKFENVLNNSVRIEFLNRLPKAERK